MKGEVLLWGEVWLYNSDKVGLPTGKSGSSVRLPRGFSCSKVSLPSLCGKAHSRAKLPGVSLIMGEGSLYNTDDWAANLGLCSALRAFKKGGIFIVSHLLRHGTSVYTFSSERPAPMSHSGIRTPTQGSSDLCARCSNHCATRAATYDGLFLPST
jgi:hypothetical protein